MAKQLSNLDPAEVSLVPEGANQRRFLVLKSAETQQAVDQMRTTPKSLMERVVAVLKSFGKKDEEGKAMEGTELSPGAQTALKATARILAPHKDEITDAHMDAIQEQVGIEGDDGEKEPGEDDMKGAHESASKAYKAHLEKLGFAKYPELELAMKGMKKPSSDDDDDDEEEETVGKEATQVETKVTPQPILKEDGTVNLEAVPAEMRPFAELVAKQMGAANQRAEAAEKKLETVSKELETTRSDVREKELVAKAASFPHLNKEDVLKTLRLADKAGKEELDRVSKMFEGQEKLIAEGEVFKELGSGQSREATSGASDAWAKIEKAADGIVQKSAEKISKEQAIEQFLKTPEGQALYDQYKGGREKGA